MKNFFPITIKITGLAHPQIQDVLEGYSPSKSHRIAITTTQCKTSIQDRSRIDVLSGCPGAISYNDLSGIPAANSYNISNVTKLSGLLLEDSNLKSKQTQLNMNTKLFSYGTLQLENVQIESFGRALTGSKDSLKGFKLDKVEITDAEVLRKSGQQFHPVAIESTNPDDVIEGIVFTITTEELNRADQYETEDYKRIGVILDSGTSAWIYVKN